MATWWEVGGGGRFVVRLLELERRVDVRKGELLAQLRRQLLAPMLRLTQLSKYREKIGELFRFGLESLDLS